MVFDVHEDIPVCENIVGDFPENDNVEYRIKPIQPTPTFTGEDAVHIVKQVLKAPSSSAIERNKTLLEMRKRIEKKEYNIKQV